MKISGNSKRKEKVQHSSSTFTHDKHQKHRQFQSEYNMEASDNDIEVLSDAISAIKILDENENPQKDDDIIVFSRKIFFVLYEKFKKKREI